MCVRAFVPPFLRAPEGLRCARIFGSSAGMRARRRARDEWEVCMDVCMGFRVSKSAECVPAIIRASRERSLQKGRSEREREE